jgi:hypothetical protein
MVYLILCKEDYDSKMLDNPISFTTSLFLLNSNDSQFSSEEMSIDNLTLGFLLLNVIIFALQIRTLKKQLEIDYALLLLSFIIACEALENLFQTFHLWSYADDGVGNVFCKLASLAIQTLSRYLLTIIVLLIASGWSINYESLEDYY